MTEQAPRKLRVGILGVGPIAQIAHLPALIKAHNIDLLAACDVVEEVLTSVATRYQIPRAYTSADQLWADRDIEAVIIPVADHLHAPLSIAAMQADKHVLVEKPLAPTLAECEEMVKVAHRTNRQLQIGCMKRFDPALEAAQRFVHGTMGQPLLISGWSFDSKFHGGYYGEYVRSLALPWLTGKEQKRWQEPYSDPMLHALLGHGIHVVDLLRFFGGEIVAVTAQGKQLSPGLVSTVLIEYTSGACGTFTLVMPVQMDWSEGLHIHGEHGSVLAHIPFPYAKQPSKVQMFDARANEYRMPTSPDADQYERQAEAFADAILNGFPVSPSGEDGLAAEKVLYAMYESQLGGGRRMANP